MLNAYYIVFRTHPYFTCTRTSFVISVKAHETVINKNDVGLSVRSQLCDPLLHFLVY